MTHGLRHLKTANSLDPASAPEAASAPSHGRATQMTNILRGQDILVTFVYRRSGTVAHEIANTVQESWGMQKMMTQRVLVAAAVLLVFRAAAQAQAPTSAAPVFTAEQASTGLENVEKNAFGRCSDCHAAGLTGRTGNPDERPAIDSLPEELQKTIRDTYKGKVPPLAGPQFLARWGGKSTKSLSADLQRRFDAALSQEVQL